MKITKTISDIFYGSRGGPTPRPAGNITSEEGLELRMLKLVKEIEKRLGRFVSLEEVYYKSVSIFPSGEVAKETIKRMVDKKILHIPREGFIIIVQKPQIEKDSIESDFCDCILKPRGVQKSSRIYCNRIEYVHERDKEYFSHYLMFYQGSTLVFRVWLPNNKKDKEFKDIFDALKKSGIKCLVEKN